MWDMVQGHEQNKEFLQRFLEGTRQPSALLFYGPAGIGKSLLAKAFAGSFLCPQHSIDGDACPSCRAFKNGTNMDFITVARRVDKKEILIEQIKELNGKAAYAPMYSNHRVCLIDGADELNAPAANSLLKLLEEPPQDWLFILTAADVNRLLSTILSRVVQLRFDPLSEELVRTVLQQRGIEQSEVIARLAAGSIGKGIELADYEGLFWRGEALKFLSVLPEQRIMVFLAACSWQQPKKKEKDEAPPMGKLFLEMLLMLLRDGLFCKEGLTDRLLNLDLAAVLQKTFDSWHTRQISRSAALAEEAFRALAANADSKSVLEALALQMNGLWEEEE